MPWREMDMGVDTEDLQHEDMLAKGGRHRKLVAKGFQRRGVLVIKETATNPSISEFLPDPNEDPLEVFDQITARVFAEKRKKREAQNGNGAKKKTEEKKNDDFSWTPWSHEKRIAFLRR